MERRHEIDTIRGVACLLLVLYHVVGEPDTGLLVTDGLLRDFNDFLAYIRMPLFTFLSGYVYAWRPYRTGAASFIRGKARRLLIPLLVVGTGFAILQALVPGTNSSVEHWYLIHIVPHAHFWFVESLFLIFLLVVVLESAHIVSNPYGYSVTLVAATGLYLFVFGTELFSVSGAIYLLPFFLAGLGCCRFELVRHTPPKLLAAVFAGALLLLLWQNLQGVATKRSLTALVLGVAACMLLLRLSPRNRLLAWIGLYSYTIYLFHTFFTGGSRILLMELGVQSLPLLIIAGTVLGVAGPIVVDWLASQHWLTRTLLLGKRWRPEPQHSGRSARGPATNRNF